MDHFYSASRWEFENFHRLSSLFGTVRPFCHANNAQPQSTNLLHQGQRDCSKQFQKFLTFSMGTKRSNPRHNLKAELFAFAVLFVILVLPRIESSEMPSDGEQCNKTKKAEEAPPLLGLPSGDGSSSSESTTHKLVLGEGYSLYDKMGPLVINDDGSTRRIANWDVLTLREKQNTLRVLSRRNKVRSQHHNRTVPNHLVGYIWLTEGFSQQRIEKLRAAREEARKMATESGIIPDVIEDVAEAVQSEFRLQFDALRSETLICPGQACR
jgi:hypothetical protein